MKTFEVTVFASLVYVVEAADFDEAQDIAKDVSGWSANPRLEICVDELADSDVELAKTQCDEFYPAKTETAK